LLVGHPRSGSEATRAPLIAGDASLGNGPSRLDPHFPLSACQNMTGTLTGEEDFQLSKNQKAGPYGSPTIRGKSLKPDGI
jgi:hypothetical protein